MSDLLRSWTRDQLKWWTRDHLRVARKMHPEAGTFREEQGTRGPCGGAHAGTLTVAERQTLSTMCFVRVAPDQFRRIDCGCEDCRRG
jgi:hypothetical protein